MFNRKNIIELVVIFWGVTLLSHCTPANVQKETNLETFFQRYAEMKPGRFHKEIEQLQENAQKPLDSPASAPVHLQLALLYGHHRNQAPNYSMALKELETYISLAPEEGKAEMIQNWLSLLKEIVRLDRENKEMKEKVEQLKDLDIELEKRRKLVK
ncbi:MAG TPA: hypothetical protein DCP92_14025 [Nitrospiraceae bacterium]|jgi:outer membrane protein assembly factor BamD (BamD/ComL family)|nr:hypothetical protein [Nitrospiraceae bacterium]